MGYRVHKERAEGEGPRHLPCAVITVSDTRTVATDESGALLASRLQAAGHHVVRYEIVPDEPAQISALIAELAGTGCAVLVLNGGTGIARRDSTFEAVDGLLEKRLPGFGELFRMRHIRGWDRPPSTAQWSCW